MPSDNPWPDQRAALAAIIKAAGRLEAAQVKGTPEKEKAQRAFHDLIEAYEHAYIRRGS